MQIGYDHGDAVDDRVLALAFLVGTDQHPFEDVRLWLAADNRAQDQWQRLAADCGVAFQAFEVLIGDDRRVAAKRSAVDVADLEAVTGALLRGRSRRIAGTVVQDDDVSSSRLGTRPRGGRTKSNREKQQEDRERGSRPHDHATVTRFARKVNMRS